MKEAHNISPEKVPKTPKKVVPTTKMSEKTFESKTQNEFQFEENLKIKEEVIEGKHSLNNKNIENKNNFKSKIRNYIFMFIFQMKKLLQRLSWNQKEI